MQTVNLSLLILVVFVAGWGWGQWAAERNIRIKADSLMKDRLSVSMPMKEEVASSTLGLLQDLVEQVEKEKP